MINQSILKMRARSTKYCFNFFKYVHLGGQGCVLDCSMTEGVAYLASFVQYYYEQSHLFTDKYAAFTGECPIYRYESYLKCMNS